MVFVVWLGLICHIEMVRTKGNRTKHPSEMVHCHEYQLSRFSHIFLYIHCIYIYIYACIYSHWYIFSTKKKRLVPKTSYWYPCKLSTFQMYLIKIAKYPRRNITETHVARFFTRFEFVFFRGKIFLPAEYSLFGLATTLPCPNSIRNIRSIFKIP